MESDQGRPCIFKNKMETYVIEKEPDLEYVGLGRHSIGHGSIAQGVAHHNDMIPILDQRVVLSSFERVFVLVERVDDTLLQSIQHVVLPVLKEIRDHLHIGQIHISLTHQGDHRVAQAGAKDQHRYIVLVQELHHGFGAIAYTVCVEGCHLVNLVAGKLETPVIYDGS